MIVVVDASVAVKWVLRGDADEEDTDYALALLAALRSGTVVAVQPPHWLLEVAAVVVRLQPKMLDESLELLDLMDLSVAGEATVIRRGARLAEVLDHHLFDTLYHAVAIEHEGMLVTADGRYARKASPLGRVVELRDWPRVVDSLGEAET